MKQSECIGEVRRLLAAFPSKNVTADTAEVYVEALTPLAHRGALHDAVTALIASQRWLPPVALIREQYRVFHEKYTPPAIAEPELSEEEIAENVQRWKVMREHLAQGEGHAATFEECEHPDCKQWLR